MLIGRGRGLLGRTQHNRHVRPVNVGVEQPNFVPELYQSECEIHGNRGLAYAAFAAGYGNKILYAGNRLAFRLLHRCWRHFVFLDVNGGVMSPQQFLRYAFAP